MAVLEWRASQRKATPQVRVGSESVIRRCLLNVRIPPESGSRSVRLRCRTSANSGYEQSQQIFSRLFYDFVGDGEQRRRNGETECVRGLQVQEQLELGRLLHWKISRFRPLKNPVDIPGRALPQRKQAWAVGQEPAGFDELPRRMNRRQVGPFLLD